MKLIFKSAAFKSKLKTLIDIEEITKFKNCIYFIIRDFQPTII